MKSSFLYAVWCSISGEASGDNWNWSLLGVEGLLPRGHFDFEAAVTAENDEFKGSFRKSSSRSLNIQA